MEKMFYNKKILAVAGFFLFFLLILAYGFFGAKDLIFGVKIREVEVDGVPAQSGATSKNEVVALSGNARNAIFLSLNGREISLDQKGDFAETIALSPGYNIINISARDKFGYTDEKNYQVMLAPPSGV